MDSIDISGIDKAALLAALYNGTRPLGWGILHDKPSGMTAEEAAKFLDDTHNGRFDYVAGRPIKVEFAGDQLKFARLYDRDTHDGACQAIVDRLRSQPL